jgi:hypothetical protein
MEQDNPNSSLEPNFTAIADAYTLQTQVLQQFLSTMPTTITAIPPPIPPKYHTKYYPSTALRFKISTIWILAPRKDKHTVDKLTNSPFNVEPTTFPSVHSLATSCGKKFWNTGAKAKQHESLLALSIS